MSQQRIGAARTSPLLATVPLFGAGVAALTLREAPRPLAWLGIVLIVAGATLVGVARSGRAAAVAPRDAAFGLGCALAWSISPVLIRKGLEGLASPLLGLTMGMVCVVLLYAAALPLLRRPERGRAATREALVFKLGAGVLVGLSTWARWAALDDTGVAVVLALGLLSVPVVLALSPLLVGRELEAVTPELLAAAALVVGGSLLLMGDA
jgi:drug/metabolite transporter (DMT)-like permease